MVDILANTGGTLYDVKGIIIHYTGSSAESAINTFKNPASKVSAHYVIDQKGNVTNVVPETSVAYHAGKSRYGDLVGLNKHTIGIELESYGICPVVGRDQNNTYMSTIIGTMCFSNDDVMLLDEDGNYGMHLYTAPQLEACMDLVLKIKQRHHNSIYFIAGHEEVSPNRKQDPSIAFPMGQFKALFDRRGDVEMVKCLVDLLNVRSTPEVVKTKPSNIRGGMILDQTAKVIKRSGDWVLLETIVGNITNGKQITGWCHGDYLAELGTPQRAS